LQNFYFSQKVDVQYKWGSLESNKKINLALFAGKLMVSIVLSHKDLPYYKDFLGEDKESGTFESYEKLSWIKIGLTRNNAYMERVNYIYFDCVDIFFFQYCNLQIK